MPEPKRIDGADWLVGHVTKKAEKRITPVSPAALDDVERFLDDASGDGKRLVAGLKKATDSLELIRQCGLTGDALVTLVLAKCGYLKNGNLPTENTVRVVLEALFKLGEHLR